ncbi:MAG: cyclodeaminase/cyclohydrolase family protein [Candidatus Limnocylindrales bacterium]
MADHTVREFITALGASAPTPGGGSGAAVIGATAASLLGMVAELSAGRAGLAPFEATIGLARRTGLQAGADLLALADRDAEAFSAFMDAWGQSRDWASDARREAVTRAARAAAEAPRRMLDCCVDLAESCEALAGRSNPNLASDLVCASYAVEAAAHCAAENVYVNLPNIDDRLDAEALRLEAREKVAAVERDARACRRMAARGVLRKPRRTQKPGRERSTGNAA